MELCHHNKRQNNGMVVLGQPRVTKIFSTIYFSGISHLVFEPYKFFSAGWVLGSFVSNLERENEKRRC